MKLKKRIKKLEAQVSELKKQVQSNCLVITDSENPHLNAVISLKAGDFKIEKITTQTNQTSEPILIDNK